jgi:predicted acetyltransferase
MLDRSLVCANTDGALWVLDVIAPEEAATLHSLMQLYAHDFSEFMPLEVEPNGRFALPATEHWWSRDDHFPFFIRRDGKLAGFALVRRGSRITGDPEVMDMAEFFVLRGERRHGIGRSAAHALFAAFPGTWEVRVRRTNVPAHRFWLGALEAWASRLVTSEPHVSPDGVERDVFRV